MKFFYFIFITLIFRATLWGQLDNTALLQNTTVDTTEERRLFVKIQNLNYMKNNEYTGVIADGFTLFGVQLNPQLGYQLTKNLSIEGGIYLRKDFGNNDFKTISPTFSLRYQKKDFKMIFGNINGSLNHQLIEPLYNFERVITDRLESGAQFILNKKYFDFDAWIDWQRATYPKSVNREKLWAGLNLNALKLKFNKLEFSIPLQGTILHTGGQIDISAEKTIRNINYSPGIMLKYNLDSKHISSFYADARFVGDQRELYDSVVFRNVGHGLLADVGITAFKTNLLFTYWYGDNYKSDYGGYLYSSESSSVHFAGQYQRYRSLIIMRLTRTFTLAPKVFLTLRLEPYYDINTNLLEYSYGFYINFDEKFWIKK